MIGSPSSSPVEVRSRPGRGRGLFAARLIQSGEVVLSEPPVLLYAAQEMAGQACAGCLRLLPPAGRQQAGSSCQACRQAAFCSPACAATAAATPWGHSPAVCRAYARIGACGLAPEEQNALRFLAHALALKEVAANGSQDAQGRYQALLQLTGEAGPNELQAAARLQPLLYDALGIAASPAAVAAGHGTPLLAALLRKEQLNSYGITLPPRSLSNPSSSGPPADNDADETDPTIRGTAIYAQASLLNHECIPNVARFDAFDAADRPSPSNTVVAFRALHALPAGTELVLSYTPLNWDLASRQAQCSEVYGFTCSCPRCQTEAQWQEEGGEEEESSGSWEADDGAGGEEGMWGSGSEVGGEAMEEDAPSGSGAAGGSAAAPVASGALPTGTAGSGGAAEEQGPLDPTYLRLFLLKYICPHPGCFGTMAPAGPPGPPAADTCYECNNCGLVRTEAQFLADLE